MIVGNLDSSEHNSGIEQKNGSSETGPGITVYAPNKYNECVEKRRRISFNNSYRQNNITGTSMASPQVCGLGACILQLELPLQQHSIETENYKLSKPR